MTHRPSSLGSAPDRFCPATLNTRGADALHLKKDHFIPPRRRGVLGCPRSPSDSLKTSMLAWRLHFPQGARNGGVYHAREGFLSSQGFS